MKLIVLASLAFGGLVAAHSFAADATGTVPEHLRHLEESGDALRAEADPARRTELMHEHHAMMRRGMDMMEPRAGADMSMEERMTRMEEHMEMMRSTMRAMMDTHAPATETEPAHQHGQ